MAEFEKAFVQQQLFSSGFGVCYSPGILTAKDSSAAMSDMRNGHGGEDPRKPIPTVSHQHLATKIILGMRFPSFKVINHCDARSWHFAKWLKADGLFHVVLFAGDVSQPAQMERVHTFAREVIARPRTSALGHLSCTSHPGDEGEPSNCKNDVAQILTIHSAPRQQVEFHDFPPLLRPFDEELGYDYNRIFVDEESYYEGHGHAYEGYGVDRTKGCVIVVRPDQHVAWIGELEDVQGLEAYFAAFYTTAPKVSGDRDLD